MTDENVKITPRIPSWRYREIEKKVVNLYKENGFYKPPIDPYEIIKNRGYKLVPFSRVDGLTQILKEDKDAFSFLDSTGTTNIVYNDDKSYRRLRFTLMHEIGHVDLGHKERSALAEKEANYYAGYALAPSPFIMRYASKDKDVISNVFWISPDCANRCATRYVNWILYGGEHLKDYEEELLSLSANRK